MLTALDTCPNDPTLNSAWMEEVYSPVDGERTHRQEDAELYLMSLDVRPESDLESFTCLQHL